MQYATGPAGGTVHDSDVVAADLDDDSNLDLVVANCGGDSVSILKGGGDGTFGFHADYETGVQPCFVAVADFNADGRNDVVTADDLGGEISVFMGRGDCTLAGCLVNQFAWNPTSVVAGDFDGDGADDVAFANYGDGSMSVLPGDGDGSFSPGIDTATDGQPWYLVSADFNRDGKLDLAAADTSATKLQILLGKGNGSFNSHVDYSMGAWNAYCLEAGDFNADGKADLAAGSSGYVRIFMGRGDGTFNPGSDVLIEGGSFSTTPSSLTVGDFTGDGKQDIVTANGDVLAPISVLVGNGDGTFVAHNEDPVSQDFSAIAAGDFNGDGKQDVVVALSGDPSVAVLLGNGSSFALQDYYSMWDAAGALVSGDFNGDGNVDIAAASDPGVSGVVSVLLGNGDGSFSSSYYYYLVRQGAGFRDNSLGVGDFDDDGHPDLATANYGDSSISVMLHTPSTEAEFFGKSAGTWYFHIRAVDAAGVVGPAVERAVRVSGSASPAISTLTPNHGLADSQVIIAGTNLGASGTVFFGSTVASVQSWSATSIVATVPAGSGTVNVTVATGGKTSNGLAFTYDTVVADPVLSSVSPNHGKAADTVVLTGTNLGTSGTVNFGSTPAATTSWNATTIVATVPAGSGTVNVTVSTGGKTSNAVSFAYDTVVTDPVLSSVNPSQGAVGSTVVLSGTSLGTSGTVNFGATSATTSSWNATTIVCTVPNGLGAGAVNVTVSTGGKTSNAVVFTVGGEAPTITSITPNHALPGDAVVISGSNLGGSGTVRFGTTAATTSSWTATTIVCTVPALSPGVCQVTVTVGGLTSNGLAFTVEGTVTPVLSALVPSQGAVNSSVVLTGTDLGTSGTVFFGATTASTSSWSATAIVATVPSTLGAGPVNVTVSTGGKTSNALIFTVLGGGSPPTMSFTCPADLAKWHNHDLPVTFTVTDPDGDADVLRYSGDGSTWYDMDLAVYDTLNFPAEADHSWDGATLIHCKAHDLAGHESAEQQFTVRIDTQKPTAKALYAVTVVKGRTATLKYKIVDPAPNGGTATAVKIVIKNRYGKVVKTFRIGTKKVNTAYSVRFTCKLPKGSYRFYVSGRDVAGNTARVGSNRLTVK